ncbi:MAG: glycosyltransferase [Nitrospirae bacterium]|nr:glycosyltransferase [Nitrospirota bacterium]
MIQATSPFVSVVIPTYNRRKLLKSTIESLLHQSYPMDRYEIIVIDNSSSDGTEEMVNSLRQNSLCSLSYYRKKNEGPGASRNLGIAKTKGTIIAFTDSDCVADTDWLKNGVARMTNGIGLVQGKTLPHPGQPQRLLQHTMNVVTENGFYPTCNIFYRKDALDQVGGISPDFCGLNCFGKPRWGGEDTDLAWKIKEHGWRSVFADDAVIYHHVFIFTSLKEVIRYARFNVIFALAHNIKRHPALRNAILYRKIFKSKQRALFYLFVFSLISGNVIHWGFYFFTLPYLARLMRVTFHGRSIRSYYKGLSLFLFIIFVEIVESVLSICASLRYRTIIL